MSGIINDANLPPVLIGQPLPPEAIAAANEKLQKFDQMVGKLNTAFNRSQGGAPSFSKPSAPPQSLLEQSQRGSSLPRPSAPSAQEQTPRGAPTSPVPGVPLPLSVPGQQLPAASLSAQTQMQSEIHSQSHTLQPQISQSSALNSQNPRLPSSSQAPSSKATVSETSVGQREASGSQRTSSASSDTRPNQTSNAKAAEGSSRGSESSAQTARSPKEPPSRSQTMENGSSEMRNTSKENGISSSPMSEARASSFIGQDARAPSQASEMRSSPERAMQTTLSRNAGSAAQRNSQALPLSQPSQGSRTSMQPNSPGGISRLIQPPQRGVDVNQFPKPPVRSSNQPEAAPLSPEEHALMLEAQKGQSALAQSPQARSSGPQGFLTSNALSREWSETPNETSARTASRSSSSFQMQGSSAGEARQSKMATATERSAQTTQTASNEQTRPGINLGAGTQLSQPQISAQPPPFAFDEQATPESREDSPKPKRRKRARDDDGDSPESEQEQDHEDEQEN